MAYQTKSYRKFVATAATAALVASAVAPAASAASVSQFKDVASKYQDAVKFLVDNNITQGTSETTFGTYDSVKRGDAAVWIASALGLDTTKAPDAGFKDVNSRVAGAVNALYAAKVISGKSETSFAPDATLTRGEMAKIIANAYNLESDAAVPFKDLGPSFGQYIKALYAFDITTGTSETTFGTGSNITRGDFAIFLKRASEVVLAPEVVSVSAINGKQVEVKFTQAVDPASLFADGVSGAFAVTATVTLTSLDTVLAGGLTGELSKDGKTLTINTTNAVSKRYDVLIDGLKTTKGEAVAKYQQVVTFVADTTAPFVVSTSKPTSGTVKVVFSEPMSSLGTLSFKKADGTAVTTTATGVTNDFGAGGKKEVIFTLGSEVLANETVTATIIGAQDQAGNLINPNPATIALYKGSADGVAPVVASVTQTGAKTLALKFSEELQTLPVVSVAGAPATVVKDDIDPTKYNVTAAGVLDGATTVAISNFTDLSGVAGTPVSKVVNFVKDSAAPKVVSSVVVTDATDAKQYLEFTFDKDVTLTAATVDGVGSYVKNYVTTPLVAGDLATATVTYKNATTSKKVVRVELDTFLATFDTKDAVYNLDLTFSGVTSAANIAATDVSATFTRGEDGTAASTVVANVVSVAQGADNDKVEVVFDTAVDGASAITVANYNISGAQVDSVTLLPYDSVAGTQTAIVNLKANSNGFTGTRNINISNVKALGSTKVMNPFFTNTVSLAENVKATVTSAKLTATNQVTLTFSEAITAPADATDFELYIGGVKLAANDAVTTAAGTNVTTLVLTLEDDVTTANISSGLTLKALPTLDIVDSATNKLSVPTTGIVITQ